MRNALIAVAGKDEAVPALVGMDTPHSDLRVEELRLQNDREVLLDFRVGDTEPAEVRLVVRELEEFVLVLDRDIAGLLRIGVNRWPLAFPQIPVSTDAILVERHHTGRSELAVSEP